MRFNIQKKEESYNKTIRLPESIIDKIDQISARHNISFSKVILNMIEFSLDNMDDDETSSEHKHA